MTKIIVSSEARADLRDITRYTDKNGDGNNVIHISNG